MRKALLKVLTIPVLTIYLLVSCVPPVLAASNSTFSYDANGNMTSDGQLCYTYNEANELSQVKNCASSQLVAEYVYDYQGIRIAKKEYTNGVLSQTVYSPSKEFETVKKADGTTQNTSYYFANDQLLAKKNPDGTKTYYQNDQLGSTSLLTDQSGNVFENTVYYPYGGVISGGTASKYQYTGQEKDSETGLNYYNSRYYNSNLARFVSPDSIIPDPYNPQTLNRYSYVNNNPIKNTDPTGHETLLNTILSGILPGYGLGAGISRAVQTESYALATNQNFFQANADPNLKIDEGQQLRAGLATNKVGVDFFLGQASGQLVERGIGYIAGKLGGLAGDATETVASNFNAGNLRENLIELTGENPSAAQAHHMFPQTFRKVFEPILQTAGETIDNPKFASWWPQVAGDSSSHLSNVIDYNVDWYSYFIENSNPTFKDVLSKGAELGIKYGLKINY